MASIAFVILTWNSEKYIENCINSICTFEKYTAFVYVVDNGSTDGTLQIIEQLKRKCKKNVKIFLISYKKNMGTTASRNAALKRIDHDINYICILDSDTEINEKAVDILIEQLMKNEKLGIVGPKMKSPNGSVQPSGRNIPTITEKMLKAVPIKAAQRIAEHMEEPQRISQNEPYEVGYLMSACWLMRRSLIDQVGLFDEKIFYAPEDAEYCIRVWKAGYKVSFCPQAEIMHAWQRISKKRIFSKMNLEHIKGLFYMFKKYKCWFSSRCVFENK